MGVGIFWGFFFDDYKVFVKVFLGYGFVDVIVWIDFEFEVFFVVVGDLDGSFYFCGFCGKLFNDYFFSVFFISFVFVRFIVSIFIYFVFFVSFNVFL